MLILWEPLTTWVIRKQPKWHQHCTGPQLILPSTEQRSLGTISADSSFLLWIQVKHLCKGPWLATGNYSNCQSSSAHESIAHTGSNHLLCSQVKINIREIPTALLLHNKKNKNNHVTGKEVPVYKAHCPLGSCFGFGEKCFLCSALTELRYTVWR